MRKSISIIATIFLAVLWSSASHALAVDWKNSFVFGGGTGLTDFLAQVAFNPQPEPPAGGALSLVDPGIAGYPPDPIITHQGAEAGDQFRMLFGMSGAGPLSFEPDLIKKAPDGGLLAFDVFTTVPGLPAGVKIFRVEIELMSESLGVPFDYVAFNPQPEPPAVGLGGDAIGGDFSFTSFSDVSLRLRIMDANGNPFLLRQVPEPSTLALFTLTLMGLSGVRRLHKS